MINVLIADDHAVVREGLKQILSGIPDMVVTGEAGSRQEVMAQLEKGICNIVLLDITMPGSHGLELLSEIKNRRPELQVLVLSIHPEEQWALRALRAGASGYLSKESASEELVAAVKKIAYGGRYISATLAEKLAFDLTSAGTKLAHESLSNRE